MEIDTGVTERLTRVGTLNDSCAWNPRDDLILFSGMDTDREFDIFAMNSMGQNMERLTYDAKNNESPSWSPDGKLVVFSSRRGIRNQIFVMKADGTQVLPLVELPGDASQPSWSPRLGYK
jgi:TolB protein